MQATRTKYSTLDISQGDGYAFYSSLNRTAFQGQGGFHGQVNVACQSSAFRGEYIYPTSPLL